MAIDLVEHNPRLKAPVACVLGLLADGKARGRAELEEAAAEAWSASFAQKPAVVVDTLVRAGAVSESLSVDGEVYEGSLEDIQLDESVPLEADVSDAVAITEAGRELASSIDSTNTLRALFAQRPHYETVFKGVLVACLNEEGATREALERVVETDGAVISPEGERVYPQFFIDALESAGGIVWDGAWHATEAGRQVVSVAR